MALPQLFFVDRPVKDDRRVSESHSEKTGENGGNEEL